jgi:hypothetical protein
MERNSIFGDIWPVLRDANVAYALFACALVLLTGAVLLLRYREFDIGGVWDATTSFLQERGFNVALLLAIWLLFLLALLSLSRFLWTSLVSDTDFAMIAPFTISGADDKQRGLTLAMGLQSKLAGVRNDLETLDQQLKESSSSAGESPVRPSEESFHPLGLLRPVNIEAKIQGVDVGGLVGWFVQSLSARPALQISVAQNNGEAVVSGPLRRDGKVHVYAKVKADDERIVAAVAYSMLRERFVADNGELSALDWQDFEALHLSVVALANLRSYEARSAADFEDHYKLIARLVEKSPDSRALLTLGADVAMKAGKTDQAVEYLNRARRFLRPSDDEYATQYNQFLRQRQRIFSSCALPLLRSLNAPGPKEAFFSEALNAHRALLNIAEYKKKRDVTVAIIAGVPQRAGVGYGYQQSGPSPGDVGFDNFADTIGLVLHVLAPEARLLFVPLGPESHSAGWIVNPNVNEVRQAVATAQQRNPEIILIPFGYTRVTEQITDISRTLSDGALVITVAPTKDTQDRLSTKGVFDMASASANVAFVANADVDGRFTLDFLNSDNVAASFPHALWAPGLRIPRLGPYGVWTAGSLGNQFAAVAAAAVAANIMAAGFQGSPRDIIELLRKTSRQVGPQADVKIIDQAAALAAVSALGSQALSAASVQPAPRGACG